MKTNNLNNTIKEAKKAIQSANVNPLSNLQTLNKLAKKNEFIDNTSVKEVQKMLSEYKGYSLFHMNSFVRNSKGEICVLVSGKSSCRYELRKIFGAYYRLKPITTDLKGVFTAFCSVVKALKEYEVYYTAMFENAMTEKEKSEEKARKHNMKRYAEALDLFTAMRENGIISHVDFETKKEALKAIYKVA